MVLTVRVRQVGDPIAEFKPAKDEISEWVRRPDRNANFALPSRCYKSQKLTAIYIACEVADTFACAAH